MDMTGQDRTEVDSATKVAELERQNQELAAKVTESSRPESPAPDRAEQEQTQLNNESVGIQDAAPTFAPAPIGMRSRSEKPIAEWTQEEINADVEEYRREILEEKRQAESGSASSGSSETRLA